MDEHNDLSIESKLRQAWHQQRRYYTIRGVSRFVIWLIALLAIDFLIDWGLFAKSGMTGNIGLVLLLINVGVLGWVLWFEWLRYLKPFDPVHVSLAVEKKHPGLTSLLVSYTQLKEPSEDQPNVSVELIQAMRAQAVEWARPLDFREIVDFAQIKKLITVAGCVLLLFGILSVRWSDHVGVLFHRLAGGDVGYPTKTQVMKVTGDMTVRIGAFATINATAAGVLPDEGRLFTKPAGSDANWKELPMKPGDDETAFSRQLKGLSTDLLYYVRLGDDRSDEHRIRVISAPQVVSAKVALEFPGYMNREAGRSDQLNLEVPEGTKLRWNLTCDPPVKTCQITSGEKTFDASIDDSGTKLSFELTAAEALKYTFRWTEREQGFEYDDVEYAVRVVPDSIPEVELLRPTTNGLATVKKTLKIAARASDDHGLSEAWLVYSVNGSDEIRLPMHDFKGATGQEIGYPWKMEKAIEDLKPGTQVTFALEVADHHPDREGHLRRSATRQLTIVEPERYLEWYRAELAAQNEELKRSRDSEVISSSKVKEIKAQEGDTNPDGQSK